MGQNSTEPSIAFDVLRPPAGEACVVFAADVRPPIPLVSWHLAQRVVEMESFL